MMGQLEYFDERRLRLLMDACESSDRALSVRALCSLLIAMSVRRDRPFSPSLAKRFDALCELPGWAEDVRMAMLAVYPHPRHRAHRQEVDRGGDTRNDETTSRAGKAR